MPAQSLQRSQEQLNAHAGVYRYVRDELSSAKVAAELVAKNLLEVCYTDDSGPAPVVRTTLFRLLHRADEPFTVRLLRRPFAVTPWHAVSPGNHGGCTFPLEPAIADAESITYRSVRWVPAATSSSPPRAMWHAQQPPTDEDEVFHPSVRTLRRLPEGPARGAFAKLVRGAFGGYADAKGPEKIIALLQLVKLHVRGNSSDRRRIDSAQLISDNNSLVRMLSLSRTCRPLI
jgi:hypothetical protein